MAAGAGLYIRPRLDEAKPEPAEVQDLVLPAQSSVPQQDEAHPVDGYAPTTIAYLRTTVGQQGVFQVHKAPCLKECVYNVSSIRTHMKFWVDLVTQRGERGARLGGLSSYLPGQRGVAIAEQGTGFFKLVHQTVAWLSQPAYESPCCRAKQDLLSV